MSPSGLKPRSCSTTVVLKYEVVLGKLQFELQMKLAGVDDLYFSNWNRFRTQQFQKWDKGCTAVKGHSYKMKIYISTALIEKTLDLPWENGLTLHGSIYIYKLVKRLIKCCSWKWKKGKKGSHVSKALRRNHFAFQRLWEEESSLYTYFTMHFMRENNHKPHF